MHIKQLIENEDGTATFEGELSKEELKVVVAVGLNVLYQTGAAPFLFGSEDDDDPIQ